MNIILGSHVSFNKSTQLKGSVEESLSYGGNTFMFYTGAPQNTLRMEINEELTKEAYAKMQEGNIDKENVIVHAPYIINLANGDPFAKDFLKKEIARCSELGMKWLVLHPGSHVSLTKEEGLKNITEGLNEVLDNDYEVTILLETMAGKGTELGTSFEEIKEIISKVKYQNKIGVCLDTCHINDAGYDLNNIDEIIKSFDNIIGLDKLKCIHINDSKNNIGMKKDRHENFGIGTIGFDNLLKIIYHEKLENIPKILETPYVTRDDSEKTREYPPYKFEIESIKNKKQNENLIKEIREYYEKK